MNTAITLNIATAILLAYRADLEGIVTTRVILELSRRAVREFSRAGGVLRRRMVDEGTQEAGQ